MIHIAINIQNRILNALPPDKNKSIYKIQVVEIKLYQLRRFHRTDVFIWKINGQPMFQYKGQPIFHYNGQPMFQYNRQLKFQ